MKVLNGAEEKRVPKFIIVEKGGIVSISRPDENYSIDFISNYDRFVDTSGIGEDNQNWFTKIKTTVNRLQAKHYSKSPSFLSRLVAYIYTPAPRIGDRKTLLDFGCSTGNFLAHLPTTIQSVGIEINKNAVEICRRRKLNVQQGDHRNLDKNKKYEIIRCCHVIEHIEDYRIFASNISEILDKDGLLLIYTPNLESLSRKIFGEDWEGYHESTHFNIFSKTALEKIFGEYGLKINRWSTYPMGYSASSLVRKFKLDNKKIANAVTYILMLLIIPVDVLIAKLRMGDALYVEFVKSGG